MNRIIQISYVSNALTTRIICGLCVVSYAHIMRFLCAHYVHLPHLLATQIKLKIKEGIGTQAILKLQCYKALHCNAKGIVKFMGILDMCSSQEPLHPISLKV